MALLDDRYISRRSLKRPITIKCNDCYMSFFVENVTPFTSIPVQLFCVLCTSDNVEISLDIEDDKWKAIASNIGLPKKYSSIILVKELYRLWDPLEFSFFIDFVKDSMAKVQEGD